MYTNLSARSRKIFFGFMLMGIVLILCSIGIDSSIAHAQKAETLQPQNSYSASMITLLDGTILQRHRINGPVVAPPGFEAERQAVALPKSNRTTTKSLGGSGTEAWVIGCSATGAGDIAAFYDREQYPNITGFVNSGLNSSIQALALVGFKYPNIYTGPANGGVMPLDNSLWPTWIDVVGDTYSNNPLIASHMGVDGRATRGTIDDYWVSYGSTAPDPYITGGWTPHAWDSLGDYMYTSQSAYGNADGETAFYDDPSGSPVTCDEMAGLNLPDGTLGMKHFYESRGYTVGVCYNQVTNNVSAGGFSFAQFKAEIDAGRPVLLGLTNHNVVGIGYDVPSNQVYIHDGWDFNTHTMTWGGSYAGMALQDVSIVNLVNVSTQTFSDVPLSNPYHDDIEILYANGYTAGCLSTPLQFCPEVVMNRAQAAVFMMRGNLGSAYLPPSIPSHFFADSWVNAPWGETWAEAMFNNGLTAGCSASPLKFCPDDQLTNAQAAVFGLRLKYGIAYAPPAPSGTLFTDMTDLGFWGLGWAEQAYADGLLPACGTSGGKPKFCPDALVNRGFGASVIVKAKSLTMP